MARVVSGSVRLTRALFLVAVLGLAACQTTSGPAPTATGVGLRATFALGSPSGLLGLDQDGRVLGRITDLPAASTPTGLALHPDSRQIAFSLIVQNAKTGNGSDIFVVSLDGTGLRPLVEHEGDNVFYASPRFDPTGDVLYFHRRAGLTQNGFFAGNDDAIERLDLRTGQRVRLVANAADPAISPDGRTLVYAHLVKGQVDTLWTAGADGTNPRPLFKAGDTFFYLQAPRFRPSGCEIVFSGAGHTVARSSAGGKFLHLSVPSELFLAPCDGSGVTSVAQTGDDDVPAWSPDGSKVGFIGIGAFFVVTLASGTITTIAEGDNFFFGDLLWLK